MRRVLLFPLSGYANRLQAIASSAILAERLGARLSVCWEPDPVVPVEADAVLSAGYCDEFVVTSTEAQEEFGVTRSDIPHYLTIDSAAGRIMLAGHDRGEQTFMAPLRELLADEQAPKTLIIAAGGQFFLPPAGAAAAQWQAEFRALRHGFYRRTRLRAEIEEAARRELAERGPFMGLHLRYTDRARQAPFDRTIRAALRSAGRESGLRDVFIAGDSPAARDRWTQEAVKLGLRPWSVPQEAWDRSQGGSEQPALVDWRLLGAAERIVYFARSSFAEEAAVASAGWDRSTSLEESSVREALVRAQEYARAAVTYPRRHGWMTRSPRPPTA